MLVEGIKVGKLRGRYKLFESGLSLGVIPSRIAMDTFASINVQISFMNTILE